MNVLFDLDDTLHDKKASLHSYALALWQRSSKDIGSDCQNSFISSFIHENSIIQSKAEAFQKLSSTFKIPKDVTQRILNEFDHGFHEYAVPFPNAVGVLELLKNEGIKIACVTNGRDFFQKNKISALGFEPYFDVVVTSGGFGVKKPDHSIFKESLRLLGTSRDITCFCGDSLVADIKPAKDLGFTTIWKSQANSDLADYTFENFDDFNNIWKDIAVKNT